MNRGSGCRALPIQDGRPKRKVFDPNDLTKKWGTVNRMMNGRFDDVQIHPLTITPHIFQNNRELVENHFARSPLIFVDRLLNCQVHVEQYTKAG